MGGYDNSDDTASGRSLGIGGTLIFRSVSVLRMGLFVLRRNVGKMSVKSAVKFSPVSRQIDEDLCRLSKESAIIVFG